MQLETLACGDTQRAICIAAGQVILYQVLLSSQHASGNTRAYHKLIRFLRTNRLCLACIPACISVFLLVNTMKLDEMYLFLGEVRGILRQLLGYLPTQVTALDFDVLNFTPLARPQTK